MKCPLCENVLVKMTAILLPPIWKCKKCGYAEKCSEAAARGAN